MKFIQCYFECLRDAGFSTMFEIHRKRGQSTIAVHPFDHVYYDGMSAMLEMARQYPDDGFRGPPLTVKPKPNLFKRLYELARWYVKFYPFKSSLWKVSTHKPVDVVHADILIESWSSHDKISLNTRLMLALDKTAREHLTSIKKPRMWMSPVGLYDRVTKDIPAANRVSFIDLSIRNDTTLQELQEQLKNELRRCNYWGTILTMKSNVMFGQWFGTVVAKYLHLFFRRTGTFSNLGEWSIPGITADEWWVLGRGCVARMSPVEATALIVNGKLGLSVTFHQSLGRDKAEVEAFLNKWKENFLTIN